MQGRVLELEEHIWFMVRVNYSTLGYDYSVLELFKELSQAIHWINQNIFWTSAEPQTKYSGIFFDLGRATDRIFSYIFWPRPSHEPNIPIYFLSLAEPKGEYSHILFDLGRATNKIVSCIFRSRPRHVSGSRNILAARPSHRAGASNNIFHIECLTQYYWLLSCGTLLDRTFEAMFKSITT